jgi:hypothetical protein
MFFLVRKSRETALRELYESKLAERERIVQLLIEQVEYLRAQLGAPTASVQLAAGALRAVPDLPPPVMQELWISDDEDELHAMRQAGVIDELEFQAGIEKIRSGQVRNIIE